MPLPLIPIIAGVIAAGGAVFGAKKAFDATAVQELLKPKMTSLGE